MKKRFIVAGIILAICIILELLVKDTAIRIGIGVVGAILISLVTRKVDVS